MSAGADHMIPFHVSSSVTDAGVRKLKTEGLRIGIDIILKNRDRPYTNVMSFNEYLSAVLLPHIVMV
jgi:hypothetical protein